MTSTTSRSATVAVPARATLRTAASSALHRWHLLSLDAPTVAALWTVFVARASGISLPLASVAAMFVAVWCLYAADRLLDAQPLHRQPTIVAELERRHLFHHRHRRGFLVVLGVATVLLAALLPHLPTASLHRFLILGTLLCGYFVLIHATSGSHRLPKEIAVGLFFAAAIFIPTISRLPAARNTLALPAVLFAALCSLNCLCIYAWEHPATNSLATPHPVTRILSDGRRRFAALLFFSALVDCVLSPIASLPAAIAIAALALLLLDAAQHRLSRLTLRAAADLALTTPLLFLATLHPR